MWSKKKSSIALIIYKWSYFIKRGIDEDGKIIINNCIQRSALTIRTCDVHVYLNLDKTRNEEMKGRNQPTLLQIQYHLRSYRELTLGSGANTTEEIIAKIKANMSHPNISVEKGFYFGYDVDAAGEPIVEANNFRIAFHFKKTFKLFSCCKFSYLSYR